MTDELIDLAADLSRLTGQSAPRMARAVKAREEAMKEGREALAAALASELDAAKIDYRAVESGLKKEIEWREPGLTGAEVTASRLAWKFFADHIRQWLEAGAPERPILDLVWERINALGGRDEAAPEHDYGSALNDALKIIEQLGGMDPARRKAVARG